MRIRLLSLAFFFVVAASLPADVVTDWTGELLDSVRVLKPAPPAASRQMAFVTTAMFDAVNGISGEFEAYNATGAVAPSADPVAAAATAAHDILAYLYPARSALFAARLADDLAAIPDGAAKSQGIEWGASVAAQAVAARAGDGIADVVSYQPPEGAGWWAPTPPAYQEYPALPHWGSVRPWGIENGSRFRPPVPPSLRGQAYHAAFEEVYELGRVDSATRTADQTEIAFFWADGPGTATPPGHWLEIARDLAAEHQLTLGESSRLLALLGVAVADAAIIGWDAKYFFDYWRPVTGIRSASSDGNPHTRRDLEWTPLIPTPPFPGYVSGHSTFSGAASRILALFFGHDTLAFSTTSDDLPGVVRSFPSLSAAAEEAGQSRIYGGIHWQFDNVEGLRAGRLAADEIFALHFRPAAPATECVSTASEICALGRFLIRADWSAEGLDPQPASAIVDTTQAGRFWFFDAANTELVIKVVDGCDFNQRYWIYLAGLTTLDATVEIVDTVSGAEKRYHHSAGSNFVPISDINAFATCP